MGGLGDFHGNTNAGIVERSGGDWKGSRSGNLVPTQTSTGLFTGLT